MLTSGDCALRYIPHLFNRSGRLANMLGLIVMTILLISESITKSAESARDVSRTNAVCWKVSSDERSAFKRKSVRRAFGLAPWHKALNRRDVAQLHGSYAMFLALLLWRKGLPVTFCVVTRPCSTAQCRALASGD